MSEHLKNDTLNKIINSYNSFTEIKLFLHFWTVASVGVNKVTWNCKDLELRYMEILVLKMHETFG